MCYNMYTAQYLLNLSVPNAGSIVNSWLGKQGMMLALEVGMRHMSSSECVKSSLRHNALILVSSRFLMTYKVAMYRAWDGPSRCWGHQCISLYMSFIKSLLMEVCETKGATSRVADSNNVSSIISAQSMIDEVFMCSCYDVHDERSRGGVFAALEGDGSENSSNILGILSSSSSSNIDPTSSKTRSILQAWLRPQVIMLRSWVLFWVELSNFGSSPRKFCASTDALRSLASEVKQHLVFGRETPVMEAILEACGFNSVAHMIEGEGVMGSHARWERFALHHLDGPPLPGCSNWACTNLHGFSEAALPTKLCSGCKRVRYCSVECQKAAWVKGEHKDVCGSL